jgi:hypothetical protein
MEGRAAPEGRKTLEKILRQIDRVEATQTIDVEVE